MIRVYIAENLADAYLVCNRIQQSGITVHVLNEFADGAVGELPFTHTYPEIWVENERDRRIAREIIDQCEADAMIEAECICTHCSESNPANFEICWSCSQPLKGQ